MNTDKSLTFAAVALGCAKDVVQYAVMIALVIVAIGAAIAGLYVGVPIAANFLFNLVTDDGHSAWRSVLLSLPLILMYPWTSCVQNKLQGRRKVVWSMKGLYLAAFLVHALCLWGFVRTFEFAQHSHMPAYEYAVLIVLGILSGICWLTACSIGVRAMESDLNKNA